MAKAKTVSLPAYLECRPEDGDGEPVFCAVDRILVSPALQERCTNKRALKRILRLIEVDPSIAKYYRDWRYS
jgi:hypothetical protein